MKNLVCLLVIAFSFSTVMAQELKKDTFIMQGDVIAATLFHDNGMVAQTGFYTKDNKLQGEWVSYDTNGNRKAIAQYDNGQKVGTWTFYQGDIKKEVTYNNSKIAEVRTWEVTDTRMVTNRP